MKKIFISMLALSFSFLFFINLNAMNIEKDNLSFNTQNEVFETITSRDFDILDQEAKGNILTSENVSWAFGNDTTALFDNKGKLEVFGKNIYGNLGTDDTLDVEAPFDLSAVIGFNADEYAVSVALGTANTLVASSDGRVFSMGNNFDGQLGDGTNDNSFVPVEITTQFSSNLQTGSKITQVAVGNFFSMALGSQGEVFTWGGGTDGRLALGNVDNFNTPQLNPYLSDTGTEALLNIGESVIQVVAGEATSAFVTSEGRLFTAGPTGYFPFKGSDNTWNSNIPLDITALFSLGIGEKIIKVEQTTYQMMVLTDAGRVFVTGHGGLATGVTEDKTLPYDLSADVSNVFIDIALGAENSYLLAQDGTLYAFGFNSGNQLGLGPDASPDRVITPIIHDNLSMLNVGEKIVNVYAGTVHGAFATSEGRYFLWGRNRNGQLGTVKTTASYDSPTLYYAKPLGFTVKILGFNDVELYNQIFEENADLSAVVFPSAPPVEGYNFTGWSAVLPSNISENITINAIYEAITYTITYELNGGTTTFELTDVYNINAVDITLPNDVTKTEHTFLGWYDNPEFTGDPITSIPTGSTGNRSFYANLSINQYTITIGNATGPVDTYTFDYDEDISDFKLDDEEPLYFIGFYTDEALTTPYVPTNMPAENLTLYAKFVEKVAITFVDKDGNTLNEYTFLPNEAVNGVTYPTPPEVDGYTFSNWSLDIPTNVADSNITIEALYDAIEYTITFNSNGGSEVTPLIEDYEASITAPDHPNKEGHTFAGWFTDEALTEAFTFDIMPLDGATLYADWDLNSYDITIVTPISKAGLTELLPGETIVDIQYGIDAGVILTSLDRVFVTGLVGASGFEVEGLTANTYVDVPTLAKTDMFNEGETIIDLSFKGLAGILLTSEGRVFTFGSNGYLQIGNGDTDTSKNYTLTDITSNVSNLMDGDESIVDVFTDIYFSAIVTSSNRLIIIGNPAVFQSLFGSENNPGNPVDVSLPFYNNLRIKEVMIAAGRTLFRTNQDVIFNFEISTNSFVPVALSNALPDETLLFVHDGVIGANDGQLVGITSTNRIVNIEYTVTSFSPVIREYVENSSSNALKVLLNPDETVVSTLDQMSPNNELIILTSEGRVFIMDNSGASPVVTEVTLPEMNEDERFTHLTTATYNNYALITNLGRAFGFGTNRTVGAGLGVPPTVSTVSKTTSLVELFKISQAETPLTFEFGEELNLEPLPDQGDLIFRGYFLDPEGTIPFTSDTMPAENIILYPKFTSLLTYDMSNVVWEYEDAFTYDGTEFEVTIDETTLPEGVTVLSYTGNTATNAGTYTATVTFAYNEETHLEPVIVDLTWTINKATIDVSNVVWTDTSTFVYDTTEKVVTLENLPTELTVTYTSDRYTNAGDYTTTATFTYDTDNYEVTIPGALEALSWSIAKASLDVSNVIWTDTTTFAYDGNEKIVTLENVPLGLTVTYVNDRYTEAGDYTTTATFTYDTDNYEVTIPAELQTYDWIIRKGTIDVSNVSWDYDEPFVFNGEPHTVTLLNLPQTLGVTYDLNTFINPGTYTTNITLIYDQNNYELVTIDNLTWTILPTFTITFYDGENVLLEITNIEGTLITAPSAPLKENAVFKGWSVDVPSDIGSEDLDIFTTYLIVDDNIDMTDLLDVFDLEDFNNSDVTLTIDVDMMTDMIDDVSDFVDFRSDARMFELRPKLSNGQSEKTLDSLDEEVTITFTTTFGLDDEDLTDLELYVFDSEGNALEFTYDETTKTLSVTTSDLMIYVLTPSNSGLIYLALFAALIGLIAFLIYKGGFGFLRSRRSCFAIFARKKKDEKEEKEENIYIKK